MTVFTTGAVLKSGKLFHTSKSFQTPNAPGAGQRSGLGSGGRDPQGRVLARLQPSLWETATHTHLTIHLTTIPPPRTAVEMNNPLRLCSVGCVCVCVGNSETDVSLCVCVCVPAEYMHVQPGARHTGEMRTGQSRGDEHLRRAGEIIFERAHTSIVVRVA